MPIEVLDTNIIAVLAQPLPALPNPNVLFETEPFQQLLRPALKYSNSVGVDLARGTAAPAFQIESQRSQKAVNLSASRIEVHDLAVEPNVEESDLPDLLERIIDHLPPVRLQAVGANHEVQFRVGEGETAAQAIASRVLVDRNQLAPPEFRPIAGAARYSVQGSDEIIYTVAIEPRLNDPETRNVWVTCNGNIPAAELPSLDQLSSVLREGHRILHHALGALFADYVATPGG